MWTLGYNYENYGFHERYLPGFHSGFIRIVKTHTSSATQSASIWRRVRWSLCALAYACLFVSAQAKTNTLAIRPRPTGRNDLQFSPSHSTVLNTSSASGGNASPDLGRNAPSSLNDSGKFMPKLPLLSQINGLCPLVGLLAAIGFTHVLRRRRIAQLEAIGISRR